MKFILSGLMMAGGIIASIFYPLTTHAENRGVSVDLDLATVEKGYTVSLEQADFQLELPPGIASYALSVHLETTELPKQRGRSMLVSSVIELEVRGEDEKLDLLKMMRLHFTTTAKRSGKEIVHFWDEGKKIWRELPTAVDGPVAIAPFTLGYAKLAVFEQDVPTREFSLSPKPFARGQESVPRPINLKYAFQKMRTRKNQWPLF